MKPWYRRPLGVIAIVLAAGGYIGGNILLFYRFDVFSSSRLSSPIAKLTKFFSKADRPSPSDSAPSAGFNLGKEKKVTLTSVIRNDIPQAIDLTVDPLLTKGIKTYTILVSAHDRVGINGVTITIPSYKQIGRKQLTMVKGTAQDGIWKTDAELDYTGSPIQFVIDVENGSARTTTEVTVP